MFFFVVEKVILIEKKFEVRKRGECVIFKGEYYFRVNGIFIWMCELKFLLCSDCFVILDGGKIFKIN